MKSNSILTTLRQLAKTLWHRFLNRVKVDTEPHIWKTRSHGSACWHAYDPLTGDQADFGSEDDVRIWIEERYYAH